MCQINNISDMGFEDPTLKIKQKFGVIIRILGVFLIIQEMRKYKTKTLISKKKGSTDMPSLPVSDLKSGDRVRVRQKEQILQTLDENHKFEGCFFMEEMWQYCGSEQKVLKNVHYFFDERGARLYKVRNIVLLEGVHCSGKQGNFMPRCDRNCFVFWKEVWLERIE